MDRFSETFFSRNCDEHVSNACDNCEQEVMEDLREVFEYRHGNHRFFACHECYDECMQAIENEAKEEIRRRTILTAERLYAVRMMRQMGGAITCCNCKTVEARWDSLYCSEACRTAHLTFPEVA